MEAMLAEFAFSEAYLDDILIRSKNRKEHAEHIEKIFERIKDFGFKMSVTKCEFSMTSVNILGRS